MGRKPCCSKEGLNRGAWTAMEDKVLKDYITIHGVGNWRNLPQRAGLKRCGKSCRLRWINYLRPDIKRGNITRDEEELIIKLHKLLGNRWSLIAGRLPGRTDNEIKNYWNTNLGKRSQDGAAGQNLNSTISTSRRQISHQSRKNPSNPMSTIIEPSSNTVSTKANTNDSVVVRTKATRCTRVVISNPQARHCNQLLDRTKPLLMLGKSLEHDDVFFSAQKSSDQSTISEFVLKEKTNNESSNNFMMDLELDENFLSDFLKSSSEFEFSQQLSTGNISACDDQRQYSSPSSDDQSAVFFSNEMLREYSDFPPMASLIDSESEWLQDYITKS